MYRPFSSTEATQPYSVRPFTGTGSGSPVFQLTNDSGDQYGDVLLTARVASADPADPRSLRVVAVVPENGPAGVVEVAPDDDAPTPVDPNETYTLVARGASGQVLGTWGAVPQTEHDETMATSARFTAIGGPPIVQLIAPVAGTKLHAGASVDLIVEANNPAGQALRGQALTRTTGKTVFEHGAQITAVGPAPGRHRITLTAKSGGRAASASVVVQVLPAKALFTVLRAPGRVSVKAKSGDAVARRYLHRPIDDRPGARHRRRQGHLGEGRDQARSQRAEADAQARLGPLCEQADRVDRPRLSRRRRRPGPAVWATASDAAPTSSKTFQLQRARFDQPLTDGLAQK
jgi:hypothetical protein